MWRAIFPKELPAVNDIPNPRRQRLLAKVQREAQAEFAAARLLLEKRDDYLSVWDYFLDLLMDRIFTDGKFRRYGFTLLKG